MKIPSLISVCCKRTDRPKAFLKTKNFSEHEMYTIHEYVCPYSVRPCGQKQYSQKTTFPIKDNGSVTTPLGVYSGQEHRSNPVCYCEKQKLDYFIVRGFTALKKVKNTSLLRSCCVKIVPNKKYIPRSTLTLEIVNHPDIMNERYSLGLNFASLFLPITLIISTYGAFSQSCWVTAAVCSRDWVSTMLATSS